MKSGEGRFKGAGETDLFYQVITSSSAPRGIVIAVHGLGDHSGGLSNLTGFLAEHGFLTYALDLRGHGKSSGIRAFIRSWEEYRSDLHAFRRLAESEAPQLPVFIAAHSLGGAIGLDYCLYHGKGLAGLMAIAPAVSYELKFSEKLLIAIMGRLKPDLTVKNTSDYSKLTRDPEAVARLASDSLRHSMITPGLGVGLSWAVPNLFKLAHEIKLPLLLQYGLEDEITPPGKLRQFFQIIGSPDKQKLEYDGMLHRPFDDLGREKFLSDMLIWLDRHIEQEGLELEGAG